MFGYRPAMWVTYKTGPKKRPLRNVSVVNFSTEFILNFGFISDFFEKYILRQEL